MTSLELSVVVPVYNEVEVLDELVSRCKASAALATDRWELIIVDDCSSDGTADRLADYAQEAAVKHLRLFENVGQFRATCAGLRASAGRGSPRAPAPSFEVFGAPKSSKKLESFTSCVQGG